MTPFAFDAPTPTLPFADAMLAITHAQVDVATRTSHAMIDLAWAPFCPAKPGVPDPEVLPLQAERTVAHLAPAVDAGPSDAKPVVKASPEPVAVPKPKAQRPKQEAELKVAAKPASVPDRKRARKKKPPAARPPAQPGPTDTK